MPPNFTRDIRPALLGDTDHALTLRLRGYHPLWRTFPGSFSLGQSAIDRAHTPHLPQVVPAGFSLPYSLFARCYSGNPFWFLFLGLLRCFSSARSQSHLRSTWVISPCQEVPFGDLRIKGFMRLPGAFRSLSRPSSALRPIHPPRGLGVSNLL